jgi:hypothetical protein
MVPRLASALEPCHGDVVLGSRTEALGLLLAPRKDPANLAWFRAIYPGSFALYLGWFWAGGFPANVRDPARASLRDAIRVTTGRAAR